MIDIHCHILCGIDDGAKNMEESIAMARLAYADGIRHIIATPHFTTGLTDTRDIIQAKIIELQQELDALDIPVTIHKGNEVRLESREFVYEFTEKCAFNYLGDSEKHILLEQSWLGYCEHTLEVVEWFLQQGVRPITPHPERHIFFREQPELLLDLIKAGSWIQISVDSMLGKNSEEAKQFAEWLILNGHAHTIATDAHNMNRKPNLAEGFQIIETLVGRKQVEEIQQRLNRIIE